MKKIKTIISVILLLGCLTGCIDPEAVPYVKDPYKPTSVLPVEVTVTDVKRRSWYASTHHYEFTVTVNSEDYGLSETFFFFGAGAFGKPPLWDCEVGDILSAKICSYTDSDGNITRQELIDLR